MLDQSSDLCESVMTTFPWTSETNKTTSGVSVASSRSMKLLDALNSKYTCLQEPLLAAYASTSINNRRCLTSLRVYGSREVDEPQSSLLASSSMLVVDPNIIDPHTVKEKVTSALKALHFREPRVLVQFWSPVAVKKRWLLTTLDQPFGLGMIDEGLYMHRLESEQRMFVVDDEHGEELNPPVRVYHQKLPEWCLDMNGLSTKQNNIHGYINLPVFEPVSGCCVGVLELVTSSKYVDFAFEVRQVSKALKGENLKSPNVLEDTSFCARVGDEKRQLELDTIFHALKIVCDTHNLPLAQTWGPCGYSSVVSSSGNLMKSCSSFSKNCIGKVCMSTTALPFYVRDMSKWEFHEACKARHLDKSQGVVGRSLLSRGSCFCGDVSQLSEEEYPLVPYARMHGITSCLAIYLRSIESGDEYVIELFLPTQNQNETGLQSLVKTVKQQFKNASRLQLGDISSPHLIGEIPLNWNFEFSTLTEDLRPLAKNEKNDFDVELSKKQSGFTSMVKDNPSNSAATEGKKMEKYIDYSEKPVRKRSRASESISLEEIMKHNGKTFEEAANSLGVSRYTLKIICRSHGIPRWLLTNANIEKVCDNFSEKSINLLKENPEANTDADTVPSNIMTTYVRYKNSIVKFTFHLSDGRSVWENEVANRFNLEGGRARLKYKDEDGDLIMICVADDWKYALKSGTSLICEVDDM